MKRLRIKDNSQIEKSALADLPELTEKIADKTLGELEKEGIFVFPEFIRGSDDITRDQMVLQTVNGQYWSGNTMGFLGYGEERLSIGSRFGGKTDFFLNYLLQRVLEIPHIVNLFTDENQEEQMLNYMLFLFPYYLRTAMRKGLFKEYIRRNYNDRNVKGRIDIARHIEDNTPFVGNVAYSQREFSYDNPLMELVRHTIEFIRIKPYGSSLLQSAKSEVKLVVEATGSYELYDRQKSINQNKRDPVRHAYYREYRALQRLCLLILQYRGHQIGTGEEKINGILFDGAWLWEEYIASLISDKFYHPMNKSGEGKQRLFNVDNNDTGVVYPDFISRNAEKRIIADAKYKPNGNIGNRDYLQVLAYMFRFDAKTGFYLYPEAGDAASQKLYLNRGSSYEKNVEARNDIRITKLGLHIPAETKDYREFAREMENSETEFVRIISE